jgi:hypothetical protein
VETELLLADLESCEKQLEQAAKKAKQGDKDAIARRDVLGPVTEALREGTPARNVPLNDDQQKVLRQLHLLTSKPVLYVSNVDEASVASGNRYSEQVAERARAEGAGHVVISAAIEAEVAALSDPEEKQAFLDDLGLTESGLSRVIKEGFRLLNLITFFTAGPKEAHAWTVRNGANAPEAGGVIHSDMERGFIRAETIFWQDFVECGGEAAAKEAGKMRVEGRDYTVKDGDVFHFRFNV